MIFTNQDGTLVLNPDGTIMDDATCCCGCPVCTVNGTELQVEFTADTNLQGDGDGCAAGCTDWIQAFSLPLLTQAQINAAVLAWPSTYGPPRTAPLVGCTFGAFQMGSMTPALPLPCGATSMVAQVIDDGGLAVQILIGWADGVYVEITASGGPPAPANCISNIQGPGWNCGVSNAGNPPCDFLALAVGQSADLTLTMVP